MNRTKNIFLKLKTLIPDYAVMPIAVMLVMNAAVFWGTSWWRDHLLKSLIKTERTERGRLFKIY